MKTNSCNSISKNHHPTVSTLHNLIGTATQNGGGGAVETLEMDPGTGYKPLKMAPKTPEMAFFAIFFTSGAKIIEKSFAQ
jgi:hypothetical protein